MDKSFFLFFHDTFVIDFFGASYVYTLVIGNFNFGSPNTKFLIYIFETVCLGRMQKDLCYVPSVLNNFYNICLMSSSSHEVFHCVMICADRT